MVRGSGSVYHVAYWRGQRREWECECDGFRVFNRTCKHIPAARTALTSKKDASVVDVWLGLELRGDK